MNELNRYSPEQENFKADTRETNSRSFSYRPFEPDWRSKPNTESVVRESNEEYDSLSTSGKLLAEASDATVVGVALKSMIQEYYGDKLYHLRSLGDPAVTPYDDFNEMLETSGQKYDEILGGYHPHGRHGFDLTMAYTSTLMHDIDFANRYKKLPETEMIGSILDGQDFSTEDIQDIQQFATCIVVFIKPEAWKQSRVMGLASFKNHVIFAPETAKNNQAGLQETLEHEYSHLVDGVLKKKFSMKTVEEKSYAHERENPLIFQLKTELAAYLTEKGIEDYDLGHFFNAFLENLEQGSYEKLVDTAETKKLVRDVCIWLYNSIPYVKGLMKESGFDPNDKRAFIEFFRTFITTIPDRPILVKMLQATIDTGVYNEGKKVL